jgi:single-strand DNA-binding protein
MDTFATVAGNLTDDPELRFTPNGHAVANFRLAVTSRVREGDAWKDGDTSFFRVNVWRQQAENVAESVAKGNRVIVSGRLKSRAWETPQGDKRSIVEIDADEVGPSLRWATARPERTSSAASKSGQFNDEPPVAALCSRSARIIARSSSRRTWRMLGSSSSGGPPSGVAT